MVIILFKYEQNKKQAFISRTKISETHSRQPWFTYSTCGTSTKNKERIKKFKETGCSSLFIYLSKQSI